MANNQSRSKRPLFFAAAFLLSVLSILLLVVSVSFLTSPPVRMQLNAWVVEFLPGEFLALTGLTGPLENEDTAEAAEVLEAQIVPATGLQEEDSYASAERAEQSSESLDTPVSEEARSAQEGEQLTVPPRRRLVALDKKEPKPQLPSAPEGVLIIPKLNVQESIETIHVRDGRWEDLEDLGVKIGWLETTGRFPKDDLAMAFIGHITLPYPGGAGPFLYLADIRRGDEVIFRSWQEVYVYQVDDMKIVSPDDVESLYVRDGSKLLLVTCTGYNAFQRTYDLRYVVQATLVRTEPLSVSSR